MLRSPYARRTADNHVVRRHAGRLVDEQQTVTRLAGRAPLAVPAFIAALRDDGESVARCAVAGGASRISASSDSMRAARAMLSSSLN